MKLAMGWCSCCLRAFKRVRWLVTGLVLVLVVVRFLLPFAVERYVNRQLNNAHDYGGRIGSVNLQLWRGRCTDKQSGNFQEKRKGSQFRFLPLITFLLPLNGRSFSTAQLWDRSSWIDRA